MFELATCSTWDDKSNFLGGLSTRAEPTWPHDDSILSNRLSIIAPSVCKLVHFKKRSGDNDEGEDWVA